MQRRLQQPLQYRKIVILEDSKAKDSFKDDKLFGKGVFRRAWIALTTKFVQRWTVGVGIFLLVVSVIVCIIFLHSTTTTMTTTTTTNRNSSPFQPQKQKQHDSKLRILPSQQQLQQQQDSKLSVKEKVLGKITKPKGSKIEPLAQKAKTTRKAASKGMVDPAFANAFGPDGVEYHMIFSTGCSTFQDWQSYVFFYHAWKSGQQGHVTRIASGCSDENARLLRQLHVEQIEIMSPGRFHLHITPEYSRIKPGINFKYFNKPFGVRHWMEHVLGYPNNTSHDDAIIMLLDPDQIVLRPFTKDFSNSTEVWISDNLGKLQVEHGVPFGQMYGFGAQWKLKVQMDHVAPKSELPSPVDNVSNSEARTFYAAGPPYIATGRDMNAIVTKWTDFVPLVHDNYPHLLAEMFAYCVAAGHLKLPHQMAAGFMVSDPTVGVGEGWSLVDRYEKNQICTDIPKHQLPHVLHYCQRYSLGKWYIGKYRLRKDFISCESNLLLEPPSDVAVQYNFGVSPTQELKFYKQDHLIKRHAFMVCTLIKALNDAAIFYKQHHCPNGNANFAKNYTFHKSMQVEQSWFDKAKQEQRNVQQMKKAKKQKQQQAKK